MRILVADDEPIERESLRVLVQRQMPGAEVVGEAGSGRQAIELAETLRPDVILMDITMPGLSGLEALREIRARNPVVRCLMVSAHDRFHLAQEALRLGAVDYLLKPVKQSQMFEVLCRLQKELDQERQRRQDELRRKEHFAKLRPLAEAELVTLLEQGQLGERTRDLLSLLDLRLEAGLCMVAGVPEQSLNPNQRQMMPMDALSQLRTVAQSLCTCAVGAWNGSQVTLVVELDVAEDEYQCRVWSMELARRLRERVRDLTGVRFRIGIGEPYTGQQHLARSYAEAKSAFQLNGISEKTIHFGDVVDLGDLTNEEAGTRHTPGEWHPTPGVLRTIEQGKRYMDQHLSEEVTLERVAQEVSLTPYYFGKIFSRVTGQTMMDYLAKVRVERAKQMLADPEVSIKEACFAVGYSDPNYFSRVFKKVTGQAPSEFRTRFLS